MGVLLVLACICRPKPQAEVLDAQLARCAPSSRYLEHNLAAVQPKLATIRIWVQNRTVSARRAELVNGLTYALTALRRLRPTQLAMKSRLCATFSLRLGDIASANAQILYLLERMQAV